MGAGQTRERVLLAVDAFAALAVFDEEAGSWSALGRSIPCRTRTGSPGSERSVPDLSAGSECFWLVLDHKENAKIYQIECLNARYIFSSQNVTRYGIYQVAFF